MDGQNHATERCESRTPMNIVQLLILEESIRNSHLKHDSGRWERSIEGNCKLFFTREILVVTVITNSVVADWTKFIIKNAFSSEFSCRIPRLQGM